jgi:hypothetical protein
VSDDPINAAFLAWRETQSYMAYPGFDAPEEQVIDRQAASFRGWLAFKAGWESANAYWAKTLNGIGRSSDHPASEAKKSTKYPPDHPLHDHEDCCK